MGVSASCAVALVVAATVGAGAAAAQPAGDWQVERDPFDPATVQRYHQLLATEPYDRALATLSSLYAKHRTAAQLRAVYEGKTDWASLVVLARLTRDAEPALALWRRAAAANDKDARAELEIAKLATSRDDRKAAWTAALARATAAEHKREALLGLAVLAVDAKDLLAIDRAYDQLVALAPKDARLAVQRGDALLATGAVGASSAVLAYDAAEKLLATDPERKLYVIMQRGRALEEDGRAEAALGEYQRVLAQAPRGYFLAKHAIEQMIAIHQNQGTLSDFVTSLEAKWPEPARAYFEWSTLGRLYEQNDDIDAAIDALLHAVKIAPTELETQRKLVQLLDSMDRKAEALVQLEATARVLPGDAALALELAERYRVARDRRAITTLERLSRELARNAGVHKDIAALFTKWGRPGLALKEIELVAALEPTDDNLVALGDAYWTTGNEAKAFATWRRLGKNAKGLARVGTVFVDHELWEDAVSTFTQAIHRDVKDPDLWRARAEVYETLERWSSAYNDAVKAASLIRGRSMADGHAIRYQLVRILGRWREAESDAESTHLDAALDAWTAAFAADPPDVEAGFMLAEYYARSPSPDGIDLLKKLRTLVPDDRAVALELVRSYRIMHKFDEALAELRALANRDPARAKELAEPIADLLRQAGPAPRVAWAAEDVPDPELSTFIYRRRHGYDPLPNLRAGMKLGAGGGVRGDADRGVTVGLFGAARLADRLAFVARLDWTKRAVDEMSSLDALALSTGVSIPLVTALKTTFALGVSHRTELRVGDRGPADRRWDRLGLAGDVSLELIPTNIPMTIGTRFEQMLSDHGRGSTVMFEVGVEMR